MYGWFWIREVFREIIRTQLSLASPVARNADSVLQPFLEGARRALQRLMGEPP